MTIGNAANEEYSDWFMGGKTLIAARVCLALCAMAVVASAAQPEAPPPQANPADEPNEELIEFLGADDHGDDAAWWELLKNARSGKPAPAAPPPEPAQ